MIKYKEINFIKIGLLLALLSGVPVHSYAEEVTLEITGQAAPAQEQEPIGPIPVQPSPQNDPAQNEPTQNDDVGELKADNIPADTSANLNIPPTDKGYTVFAGDDFFKNNSDLQSVLFSPAEKEILYSTLNRFKESGGFAATKIVEGNIIAPAQPLSSMKGGEASSIKEFNAPSFFLKSLLLPDSDSWTIWLNASRIRDYEKDDITAEKGLTIQKVTQNNATFIFKDEHLDKIAPDYKDDLIKTDSGKWDYRSKDGKIKVNSKSKTVKFTIGINQTFSTAGLIISEGFVAPTVIANPDYVAQTGEAAAPNIAQSPNSLQSIEQPLPGTPNARRAAKNLQRGAPNLPTP